MIASRILLVVAAVGGLGAGGWVVASRQAAPPAAPGAAEPPPAQGPRAEQATAPPTRAEPAPEPSRAAPGSAPAAAVEAPRFDVARVGARGMLVAAGRAAPHAEVVLLDGAEEIGRARADGRGEWVILPAHALGVGARELSLRARRPGGAFVPGQDVVLLVVPETAAAAASPRPAGAPAEAGGPLAVLLPAPGAARGAEPPRLLQGPPVPVPADAAAGGTRGGRLGLDLVDYEEGGEIRFAGSAPPGATVRLYVGQDHVGDARADAGGRWQLTPGEQPAVGRHVLRVDQVAAGGTVAARIELPFQRERPPDAAAEGGPQLVVQPGQNLWRIARRVYGRGMRYTVIYDANREQIRDPRRIYPGQVFSLPGTSAPEASSRSR